MQFSYENEHLCKVSPDGVAASEDPLTLRGEPHSLHSKLKMRYNVHTNIDINIDHFRPALSQPLPTYPPEEPYQSQEETNTNLTTHTE
jgi:hypothetical protein